MALLTNRSFDLGSRLDMVPVADPQRFARPRASVGFATAREERAAPADSYRNGAQARERNETVDYLRGNHPQLAAMVDAGMPVAETWQWAVRSRLNPQQYDEVGDTPADRDQPGLTERPPFFAELRGFLADRLEDVVHTGTVPRKAICR